jgi:hypothetical protein
MRLPVVATSLYRRITATGQGADGPELLNRYVSLGVLLGGTYNLVDLGTFNTALTS